MRGSTDREVHHHGSLKDRIVRRSAVGRKSPSQPRADSEGSLAGTITAHGLGHSFVSKERFVTAIRDVTFSIATGEFVSIVGPSGCGKSTLLNILAGLLSPTSGTIEYAGQPVPRPNTAAGYVTQEDALLPWRRVDNNVAIALEVQGVPRRLRQEKVSSVLATVGLDGHAKAFPGQLSGGMRRRVALARVLAYEPRLLLMDEPFSALDAQLRLDLQQELVELRERLEPRPTVVFVTHDVEEAVLLADRIFVMKGQPGRLADIITAPADRPSDLLALRYSEGFRDRAELLWSLVRAEATGKETF